MKAPAPLTVGIAGGTGSGKTTLAQSILAALPDEVALIEHDWYYRDRSSMTPEQRKSVNYDEPDALENALLVEHLGRLRGGKAVDTPQYDFASHTRSVVSRRVEPKPVVLVEGILLFAVADLCDAFDLRIFVDTDDDIRLLRRIRRDLIERGRGIENIEAQYYDSVRPMHLQHVAPSKRRAHLIVPEGGDNAEAVDVIVGRLKYLLST